MSQKQPKPSTPALLLVIWLFNVFTFTAFTALTQILLAAVHASAITAPALPLTLSLLNAALALAAAITLLRRKPGAAKLLLGRITVDAAFLILALLHPPPHADVGIFNIDGPLFATLLLLTDLAVLRWTSHLSRN